jgi:hypothetical protein
MEVIQDDARLNEIHDVGVGYIYNDFEGDRKTTSSMDSNKLHKAHCSQCDPRRDRNAMTIKTAGQKIFFESSKEAFAWLLEHRPGNYSKCTICNP